MRGKLFKLINIALTIVVFPIVIFIWCVGWTLYIIGDSARKTRKRELREMIDEYNTKRQA